MRTVHVEIEGTMPLAMHNIRLADPRDPYTKEIKSLTSKPARDKTDDDFERIMFLEFMGGLYGPDDVVPYIYLPTWNIIRSFEMGARNWKQGAKLLKAVRANDATARLEHDGPDDPAKLFELGNKYVWTTSIGVNRKSKVMRTRPLFRVWGLTTTLELDEEEMDFSDLERAAERAGRLEGLGDARKLGRGRYTVKLS